MARPRKDADHRPRDVLVLVECPDCQTVRVRAEEVVIRWCIDDETCSYRARCSQCGFAFTRPINGKPARTAVEYGAEVEVWSLPAELYERPGGPRLQLADVLELHLALIEPDWFDKLLALTTPENYEPNR